MKRNVIIRGEEAEFLLGEGRPWPGFEMRVIAKTFSDEEREMIEDIMNSAAELIWARLDDLNPEVET